MLSVGLTAPRFDCSAVVAGHLVRLAWQQVHENKTLILLFDAIDDTLHAAEDWVRVSNSVARLSHQRARVAVVCRNDLNEILGWMNRPHPGGPQDLSFPLIVDADGRIAALYELPTDGRRPVWGQFLIDAAGIIRQTVFSGFPLCPNAEELLRGIHASGFPTEPELRN